MCFPWHDDDSSKVGDRRKEHIEKFSQITKHLSPWHNKDNVTENKQHLWWWHMSQGNNGYLLSNE